MIDIDADNFSNGVNITESVLLDESKISLIRFPYFEEKNFRTGTGQYLPAWCFSIIIDGSSQKFCFLEKSKCDLYFSKISDYFISANIQFESDDVLKSSSKIVDHVPLTGANNDRNLSENKTVSLKAWSFKI